MVYVQVPEQAALRLHSRTEGKGSVQIKSGWMKMFQVHPPYTFLQSLECRYKQAVVGRVLAGLCLCPYLTER